jgi:DNA-binding beta-propeller fold protein YncE
MENNRIQKFTKDGSFTTNWGSKGTGNGEFNGIGGISLDRSDNVYVADMENNRIQKFTKDGAFIAELRSNNGINHPTDITINSKSNIYFLDEPNRIRKAREDNGMLIVEWEDLKGFPYPEGIEIDRSDNVYVVYSRAYGGMTIKKFSSDDSLLKETFIARLDYPIGISVDSFGDLYIVSSYDGLVLKFSNDGKAISEWGIAHQD